MEEVFAVLIGIPILAAMVMAWVYGLAWLLFYARSILIWPPF